MDTEHVISCFMGMTSVNQLAAGCNPSGWAEAQAKGDEATRVKLEEAANIWREYMLSIA